MMYLMFPLAAPRLIDLQRIAVGESEIRVGAFGAMPVTSPTA